MTAATAALLQGRKMTGNNGHAHRVTIGGGARSFEGLTAITQGIGSTAKSISNWVETTDGRYMCCWFDSTTKALQTGYSADIDFFTTDYAIESVEATASITVDTADGNQTSLFKMRTGEVVLFVASATSEITWAKCFVSESGNGDDWALRGTVLPPTVLIPYNPIHVCMPCPVQLTSGRLVLAFAAGGAWIGGNGTTGHYIYTSDNDGETWTLRWSYIHPYALVMQQPCVLPSGEIFVPELKSSGPTNIYQSSDDGVTWVYMANFENGIEGRQPLQGISFYYDEGSGTVYGLVLSTTNASGIYRLVDPTASKFIDTTQWESVFIGPDEGYSTSSKICKIGGYLAFSAPPWVIGVPPGSKQLPVKSITINRTKGAATGLTITADNKGGIYSPDRTGEWYQILWPNAEVIVEQGYGTDLVQTIKASMDSVNMGTWPQQIRLAGRGGAMKKALDQTVTGSTGNHVLIYTNSTVESIFISLCNFAGIPYGTVEATGLTIARKVFSWESFADAMQWLCELVGFEIVEDEQGILHFRRDWYPATGTSVYTFTEGVDIIALDYSIDDRDLYNQVIVHGRDADGNVLELITNVPGADYWRLPANKILKIDAPDANTLDELNVVAARAIYLMMSKFRVVKFKAIGVPHIQIGDLITVVESSSTISEIYRVTDIPTTQMDEKTYTMDLTAHWYSHGEAA
jgi:phage protein D